MQAHVSNNQFTSDCIDTITKDAQGIWHTSGAVFCGRLADQYQPGMYELKEFYDNYLGGMPAGSYQADTSSFNSSLFNLGANDSGFFSWGRYEVYFGQSYDWFVNPREYMPFDTLNPIGYFDQISANGLAAGWTCDQDAPAHSNRVDFYSNGTFTAFAYATLPSEPAVNNLCGGGTAHRFLAQLPASARGTTITAFGLDYTWYGLTQLPCSTAGSACSWPANPTPPLPPTPVYPYDGLQGVASDFPVRWNDGLDPSRRNGQYPTTYAIYYKYWPFGGFEPANYTLVVAAQPCNSVTFGTCETFVTGEPNGNFRWYVIANMDVSLITGVPNSILSTQSSVATFTVGQAAQTGISVVAGTYGGNCGASHGNVTGALRSACNTLGHCDYIVDYTILGDPAPGCGKDYVAEWTCNGQSLVQRATASPEAGFRKTVTLVCP
jgi:hypothetical protein